MSETNPTIKNDKILKTITDFKEVSKEAFSKAMTDQLLHGTGIVQIHTMNGEIKIEHTP